MAYYDIAILTCEVIKMSTDTALAKKTGAILDGHVTKTSVFLKEYAYSVNRL